jgi:hypothetical protein
MKTKLAAILLLTLGSPVFAHRRDEYSRLENYHKRLISAYCFGQQDHGLQIVSQIRNQDRSVYPLNYVQESARANATRSESLSGGGGQSDRVALLALAGLAIVCCKQFVDALG